MSKAEFVFKLNRAGVRALLRSEEMQTLLTNRAAGIRGRCGEGYNQTLYIGRNRAQTIVFAETPKALRDNSKNNTLLKAVR